MEDKMNSKLKELDEAYDKLRKRETEIKEENT